MNQKTSFITTIGITAMVMMMATAGTAMAQVTAGTGGATMTLEQLLLWIQQYNLAHPDNPIVLDMNTILSAPPQQIKTVIETHINTETHDDDGGDDDNHDNHNHHKKTNWNGLFHGGWNNGHDGKDHRKFVQGPDPRIFTPDEGNNHDNHSPSDDDASIDHVSDSPNDASPGGSGGDSEGDSEGDNGSGSGGGGDSGGDSEGGA